jgi:lipoyl(octanoyl) transferase
VHLLGIVEFESCLALQQRLVFETGGRTDGQITVLICEHPDVITVGRQGSWGHIRLTPAELASRRLQVRWLNRGGGCLPHVPGQLAVYPIVPLDWYRWTIGEYLTRLQRAILHVIAEQGMVPQSRPPQFGLWGRTGQLASFGVAVRNWTTYHGAFLNVCPAMHLFHCLQTDPAESRPMGSLVAEHGRGVKMPKVRESVVRHLCQELGSERYHVISGHPLLVRSTDSDEPDRLVG